MRSIRLTILCGLCASVVDDAKRTLITETPRTQRKHREFQIDATRNKTARYEKAGSRKVICITDQLALRFHCGAGTLIY
jgi:hypothetical protein